MNDRRRGLGRGLGALIPSEPQGHARPTDVFFSVQPQGPNGARPEPFPAPASPSSMSSTEGSTAQVSTGQVPAGQVSPAHGLAPVPGAHFAQIPVTDIAPNPRQPRADFDEDDLAELVRSIQSVGVLQPVVVRTTPPTARLDQNDPRASTFELVMGERRLRASIAAGLSTVPAIVRDTPDDDLLRDALLENLHRSELNPLEEAAAYQQLLEDFSCTHEVLADRLGRSRPQISNTIRLLRLPGPVQSRVAAGVLSAGHARALLGMTDASAMERLAGRIVAEGLSVRSVEEIVLLGEGKRSPARATTPTSEPDADVEQWSSRLADRLDTRVSIAMGKRKGRLSVEFASKDDLERILGLLAPG